MFNKKQNERIRVLESSNEKLRAIESTETFTEWDKEMGFLFVKMNRKKNIIKNYFIDIYATQLPKDNDYIREEDISEQMADGVFEVFTEIGGRYRTHLIDKYFGSNAELIKFITEDFYVDLTAEVISKNNAKIRLIAVKENVKRLSEQNKEDVE